MLATSIRGPARAFFIVLLATIAIPASSSGQVIAPPPPRDYKVEIRYQIRSGGAMRVARFREMLRYLGGLGFKKDAGPENEAEDPEQTRMTGTIAADHARELLRERHVRAILLVPADTNLAMMGDKPVKIQMELTGGLPRERQRLFSEQVVGVLTDMGFREAIGYDSRGHTRILGTIPASAAPQLLEDLRWHGSGWLAPRVPVAELPSPLRGAWPVEAIEVLAEPAGMPAAKALSPPAPVAAGQEYLLKIAPELRAQGKNQEPVRLEVILISTPAATDLSWRRDLLLAAPGCRLEGRLGQVMTVRAAPSQAANFAMLTGVSGVRLPRLGSPQPAPVMTPADDEALKASGTDRLHAAGHRGQRIRIAIIDDDFRGYRQFLGKQLPARTAYLDLAAECDPELQARAVSSDVAAVGHGTQCALAAALAAPEAEFTLLRVDADAPFQLAEAAHYIRGEPVYSVSLDARSAEQSEDSIRLQRRRDQLTEERKAILDEFGADEAAAKKREGFRAREAALDKDEEALHQRDQRFLDLTRALRGLRGVQVVACGLLWNEGYPVDDTSTLSRFFDAAAPGSSVWLQSVGNTNGQVWSGLFRDSDGSGVMAFAPPGTAPRPGRWTPELNFLGWQPLSGTAVPDLPKTKLRISVQWREPHDPSYWQQGRDAYLMPLANLRLLVLRQRDPSGSKVATDELDVLARSVDLPQRISNEPDTAMYEQTVELAVDTPGRFALRIEGKVPASIQPTGLPSLPGMNIAWELRPRVFVNVLDEAARASGRVVFSDYATEAGNPGMPADAQGVISVGAADFSGKPRLYTALGAVFGQELQTRPNLFSFDALALPAPAARSSSGANLANAFAAGVTASAIGAGYAEFIQGLKAEKGRLLRSP
ncbi:MAG TPA: hypothetical protein VGY66_12880 [Gemmataceae bacterium]|jgi:hypothetical protein|nr:hypothetical protein [Gemmataceae bacterium]